VSRGFVLGTRVTKAAPRGGRLHGGVAAMLADVVLRLHSRGRLIAQASGAFLAAPSHGD
jgi:acyl-coenzyme A thioesterase PaaI-like protein